jgi:hypothetical protein
MTLASWELLYWFDDFNSGSKSLKAGAIWLNSSDKWNVYQKEFKPTQEPKDNLGLP